MTWEVDSILSSSSSLLTAMRRLKGWFYWIFLITTGSLFITYHRHLAWYLAPHDIEREDDTHLERPYTKDSVNQVAEWRIVLEGMDGHASVTGEFNPAVSTATVTERYKMVPSDPHESHKSSDFPSEDHGALHKKHLNQVNRHSIGIEEEEDGEEKQEEEERNEDGVEAIPFSNDCAFDSCVTTVLDSESGTKLPRNDVRFPTSPNQSGASEFSVEGSACRQGLSTLPDIAKIYTEPKLNLTPIFNASVTEYYATVDHDLIVIRIQGFAVNCQAEVRLADRYGPSRLSNYTLGLGLNRVPLVVVDLMHSEPWIVNTYVLNIHRLRPGIQEQDFDASQPHKVCYIEQDCGLSFLSGKGCGLQSVTRFPQWDSLKAFASSLPPCNSGTAPGQWVMPCRDCGRKETCFWSMATWQPFNCTHFPLSRHRLRHCLHRKKILFIGDSTNRGIMHYTLEQINGSLIESDKTHDSKVYTNINGNQTALSFTYYPQFWLPTNQRPLFEESLYQLIRMSLPLANDRQQTVLVVGGVHWLAVQHLNIISTLLQRSGLSNIRVIVKTLGAGFHLLVDGLHHLTLVEQRRLVQHNSILVDHAKSLGFHVVDTFNMTMARYKDFLQGKCACHFHRVKQVLPSFTKFLRRSTQNGQGKLADMPFHYHVEGEVNAVYSEILLNRICDAG